MAAKERGENTGPRQSGRGAGGRLQSFRLQEVFRTRGNWRSLFSLVCIRGSAPPGCIWQNADGGRAAG